MCVYVCVCAVCGCLHVACVWMFAVCGCLHLLCVCVCVQCVDVCMCVLSCMITADAMAYTFRTERKAFTERKRGGEAITLFSVLICFCHLAIDLRSFY